MSLLERCLRENQPAEYFRHMKIRLRRSCRLPGRIESRLARSFHSKEINAPRHCGIERRCQALHWQRQHCPPTLSGAIDVDAPPHPALQIAPWPCADVQIDPETIRRDFYFFVPVQLRRIWLQEGLADVAIPQLIPSATGIGIREHRQHPIARVKAQIQGFPRPQQTHLGFPLGVGVQPLPVRAEAHRGCDFPRGVHRKSIGIDCAFKVHGGSRLGCHFVGRR